VHTLFVGDNHLKEEGAVTLAKNLQGTQVHTLDLSKNQIGSNGATKLADNLKGTKVETINLSWNQIDDAGARWLGYNLKDSQVEVLDLSGNQIGVGEAPIDMDKTYLIDGQTVNAGLEGLAISLQGTRVREVYLNHNQIGDREVINFANRLKSSNVKTVYLVGNPISTATKEELKKQYPHIKWEFEKV
jgi:Ran GTPase-activating protein (RanGAP) involved in mRNA processing and transport